MPYFERGQIKWRKSYGFSPANLAFIGHMNSAPNHRGKPYLDTFYEPAS